MTESISRFGRILVANRGEIAIRVFRAANELGIRTVAIYAEEDRLSLHRYKSDESYRVGAGKSPLGAYLDMEDIIRVAREAEVDAVHPGYGFLAENPSFADACRAAGIVFIGPSSKVMNQLGNKVAAREIAQQAGVPVVPATGPLSRAPAEVRRQAAEVGFPVMLKASWGGGGRGMRVVETESELPSQLDIARREANVAFGNDEVYLEKLVRRARHVEVQILGDRHGNLVHLFERDCSIQRRNQKVVERAPAAYLSDEKRAELCEAALRLARAVDYTNAGTVEFLLDVDAGEFYFIEVNPRIQVEHTVTEVVTGLDLVQAQIRIAEGARIGSPESGIPVQEEIRLNGHAMQCRVTTEDPENHFVPDYGRIRAYRAATGFGVRLDGGNAFSGALVTPHYDSLLEKVTTWGRTESNSIERMDRALREFRVRGVATNLAFLQNLINHPKFRSGEYTTRFIDETPDLFQLQKRQDRATKILSFVADVIVNGNRQVEGHARPAHLTPAITPSGLPIEIPNGHRQRLLEMGSERFASWIRDEPRVLVTDTTMRDAHQSLFATRMRSRDMWEIAPAYARLLPELFSLECWGGATFDVAMRFLDEDPWERLDGLRERVPNILLQMLLRSANAVGYTNYPDNVVRHFVQQAALSGIDLFRVFDSLNWATNMRVAMDAVLESGALCEAAICYTGDITDPARTKYDLKYYVDLAKELEAAGAQILGIKDMAGVCKPAAIRKLVSTLKGEVGLPIHFHTHDTSGIAAASVIAAIDAGVDAVDGAMDAMSGLTSQPNLGSIVAALAGSDRDPGLDLNDMKRISHYWESVRRWYAPFESDIRAGTSDVYRHAMPGGQYTNLRQQARSLGIEHHWPQVAEAYEQVNEMFGDIVKVTPTSKVVGDMALSMVTGGLTPKDVLDPARDIAFPESVVSFFRGDIGQPPGGFPEALQRKVLKGGSALQGRPGESLKPVDLDDERASLEQLLGRPVNEREVSSHLLYPKVFEDYAAQVDKFGDVSVLPSTAYFFGMEFGEEIAVDIDRGKTLVIRFLALSEPNDAGQRQVFFELNGQPRTVKVADRRVAPTQPPQPKAEDGNPEQIGAPMPGLVVEVDVQPGQRVEKGDVLVAIEAMKMQTAVHAQRDGLVKSILAPVGTQVDSKDLLMVIEANPEFAPDGPPPGGA